MPRADIEALSVMNSLLFTSLNVKNTRLISVIVITFLFTACGSVSNETEPVDGSATLDTPGELDVASGPDVTPEPDVIPEPDVTPEPDVIPEADITPQADVPPVGDASDVEGDGIDEDAQAGQDIEESDAEDVIGEPDVPVGPQPCDPPLSLSPAEGYAMPYGLFWALPSGGTGAYLFELMGEETSGLLNTVSGSYLASGNVGDMDTIRLTDEGCIGETMSVIHVVAPLEAVPNTVEIAIGQSMTFTATGGSPQHYFELVHAPSGGTITPEGLYTAGLVTTTDLLRCVDAETGQTSDIVVTVLEEAVLTPQSAMIALPVGSSFEVAIAGGSGQFSLSTEDPHVTIDGVTLYGDTAGHTTVAVDDLYTGLTTTLDVTVMAPLEFALERGGDATYEANTLAPGDVNGDGYNDAILTLREADIQAVDSGAVYIYAGGPDGMATEPARVISLPGRRQFLGRGASAKDINADGLIDLVVGANGHDVGLIDNGAVFIYLGVEGEFFEASPSTTLPGPFGYDHSGYSVTVCDFNGDGFEDIASAATYGEDRDLDGYPSGQGAIYIYLGTEEGFPLEHDDAIFGMYPQADQGGAYAGTQNLRFGEQLKSGDIDGDGLCDLVGATYRWTITPGSSNDGYLAVYRGRAATDDGPGGVEPLPSRLIGETDPTNIKSQTARRLSVGDVNGDGFADIAFGQYYYNAPDISGANHGALRLFLGGPLPDEPPVSFESPSSADRSWFGAKGWDGFGWYAGITDLDGQPPLDLIGGSTAGESLDGPGGTGHVAYYYGVQDGLPSEAADRIVAGEANGDIFGLAAVGLGDVDGDGITDVLVMAGRNDELGVDVGRPYIVSGDPEVPMVKLGLPGEAAGSEVGRDVALIPDLNGDGFPEALVGAPNTDLLSVANNAVNVGSVAVYQGHAQGHDIDPVQYVQGHVGHSTSDRFGMRVDTAGDFDGDGRTDIAILARYEDRPGTYPSAWVSDTGCTGSYSNGGAVFIYSSVVCGDATCDADEDCGSCEADCGTCATPEEGSAPGSAPLIATTPTFVWLGTQVSQSMRAMVADIDVNGDGLGDVIAGGLDWDAPGEATSGGFSVVLGRSALVDDAPVEAGKTIEICAEEETFVGLRAGDNLAGWDSLTSMGYLNDDNCEDFAVGAYAEDFDNSNQGTVRVFFGWGGEGCPEEPTYVLLAPFFNSGQSGYSVDGGHDATGDGIPDLLIGGHRLTIEGDTTGAAWLVSGDYIRGLPTELWVNGTDPETLHPYIPTNIGLEGTWRIEGEVDDEYFGAAVALVPNLSGPGRAGLAVGGTFGTIGGVQGSGGVRLYRVNEGVGGIALPPMGEVAGETWRAGSQFGGNLSAIAQGDGAELFIGAHEGSSLGLDQGSVYSLMLGPGALEEVDTEE